MHGVGCHMWLPAPVNLPQTNFGTSPPKINLDSCLFKKTYNDIMKCISNIIIASKVLWLRKIYILTRLDTNAQKIIFTVPKKQIHVSLSQYLRASWCERTCSSLEPSTPSNKLIHLFNFPLWVLWQPTVKLPYSFSCTMMMVE